VHRLIWLPTEYKYQEMHKRVVIKKRSRRVAAPCDSPAECPICFCDPTDAESPCTNFDAFPCAHHVCNVCFVKIDDCPICRMSKDGAPAIERQEREERERASARHNPSAGIVFFYRSGGGGANDHPFSASHMTVRVTGMPPGLARVLPELLASGMEFERQRQRGRPLSHGRRQATASEILGFVNGSISPEDLIRRRFFGP